MNLIISFVESHCQCVGLRLISGNVLGKLCKDYSSLGVEGMVL